MNLDLSRSTFSPPHSRSIGAFVKVLCSASSASEHLTQNRGMLAMLAYSTLKDEDSSFLAERLFFCCQSIFELT
jgi:hypothetical protein